MENPISSPTASIDPTATPATAPAGGPVTAQPNGEANGQSASVEETFGNVDPRTLPPQLRSVYDNMLRDYKGKTTKLSETVKSQVAKELEPYRTKAQTYDDLLKQEEFVRQWNEYVEKRNSSQAAAQVDPNDPQAKLLQEVQALKKSQEEIAAQVRTAEAAEVISAFSEAVDEKGQKLHPDFDKLAGLTIGSHEKAGEYSLLRTAIELAQGANAQEKLENGYKAAKATYDAIFEEGRKAGMGRLQEKVKNATNPPSSVPGVKVAAGRPKDALEALQWAKQGIAVER